MARMGEGDSRWIVSERQDGTNVNAWHWTEKDVSGWTKQRLGELLGGLQLFSDAAGSAAITELEAVNGDSFINVRKGKLIASYELDVRAGWVGKSAETGDEVRGSVKLPYISEENHDEDPELQIFVATEVPGAKAVKAGIHANRKVIFDKVHQFVKELRSGGPHSPGAPAQKVGTANGAAADLQPAPAVSSVTDISSGPQAATGAPAAGLQPAPTAKPRTAAQPKAASKRDDGGATQSLDLQERFYARPADIFEALTDERRLRAFTQSEATSQPQPGGAYSMYGGSVQGKYLEVDAPQRLVQEWRFSSWPEGTASKVTIALEEPDTGTTILRLKQTGIPREDRFGNADVLRSVEAGWQEQIFRRIKAVFGYGM